MQAYSTYVKTEAIRRSLKKSSVVDPDPEDPYVLGNPGSRSVIILYGSRSGSFQQQKSKKNLDFYYFVKTEVNVPSKINKKKAHKIITVGDFQ
jgi:hypothetical protein